MWILLKAKQEKKLKYELIKKAITVPKFMKQFGEDGNLVSVQEKKRDKALKILQRAKFTWKRNPIEVLKEKLEAADLKIDLFRESPTLFNELKSQLSTVFHSTEFNRYCMFLESVNPKDFQWQIDTIWKVLFDMKSDGNVIGY